MCILATFNPLTRPPIAKNIIAIKPRQVAVSTGRFCFSRIESPRFKQALLALVDTAIAQMEDGSIKVWATLSPNAEEVYIWIDIQAPNPVWSEAVDTLSTTPEVEESTAKTTTISPGLNFLMAQTLIETMQGNLQAVPVSEEDRSSNAASDHNLTRLQYSMPLTTLETVDS
ncbi:MAG: hypothetical protein F6J92_00625 [Symploca sp. SIO1A3]|nr:hypothetical protein [Symploca sp. SIO1A3]